MFCLAGLCRKINFQFMNDDLVWSGSYFFARCFVHLSGFWYYDCVETLRFEIDLDWKWNMWRQLKSIWIKFAHRCSLRNIEIPQFLRLNFFSEIFQSLTEKRHTALCAEHWFHPKNREKTKNTTVRVPKIPSTSFSLRCQQQNTREKWRQRRKWKRNLIN